MSCNFLTDVMAFFLIILATHHESTMSNTQSLVVVHLNWVNLLQFHETETDPNFCASEDDVSPVPFCGSDSTAPSPLRLQNLYILRITVLWRSRETFSADRWPLRARGNQQCRCALQHKMRLLHRCNRRKNRKLSSCASSMHVTTIEKVACVEVIASMYHRCIPKIVLKMPLTSRWGRVRGCLTSSLKKDEKSTK